MIYQKGVDISQRQARDINDSFENVKKLVSADELNEKELNKKIKDLSESQIVKMGTALQKMPPEAEKILDNINDLYARVLPIGTILPWQSAANATVPPAYLICDGSIVRNVDSPLDGKPLPDLRGEFLRGADDMGGINGSRNVDNGRKAGTFETDSLRSRQHTLPHVYPYVGNLGPVTAQVGNALITGYPYMQGAEEIETKPTGGDETRPRNYAVVFIMRIK